MVDGRPLTDSHFSVPLPFLARKLCLLEKKLRIASSRVGKDETVAVRQQIAALGAQYTKVWKNLETDCLVMGTFSSTFKAVSAIAFGKPVVSTKWLKNISHVRR